jgi:lipoate-protein ligase A
MALDEALLESASQGGVQLRFYRWQPATLSLGYFQKLSSRQTHAASLPLPLVRRSTGGGAIVHDRELTYSFTLPLRERFSQQPQRLVDCFHDALRRALADWGVALDRCGDQAEAARHDAPFLCFERRAAEDLLCQGFKVMGSAQRRHHGALLQHGSVLLHTSAHASHLPGIADLSATTLPTDQLQQAWTAHLQKTLGYRFTLASPESAELGRAATIQQDRYDHPDWTERR